MERKNQVPLHTRIGIKVTGIVLLVLTAIILRNCAGAVRYAAGPQQEMIDRYFQLGQENGARQAAAGAAVDLQEPSLDHPLLRKAYRQGFRKGWDSAIQDTDQKTGKEKN